MTFSPEQYIFSFLLGLITAILSASIFAYWSGVYKVKGELTARREQIDEILNEIRATASAMEVSKVTGRAQALDKNWRKLRKRQRRRR